ncbi:glycosyltransferase family 2 protein [Donghicola tyrosinivorans]|uniref:Glycosyl transferase family 2 n=1 Tax=Donghicola tyrosinivorans TaxID=1652492 RepID=A0A2T0WEY0_9RHOB|nr:glycosyltransferase family A protein [Donghicola tyrosinivorans]PRY85232.1 glycosyl transferase family 2 [Donghicola tyrosinivorans]
MDSAPYLSRPPRPVVSVVMPVYNGADTVCEAAQSILDDGFGDIELLVVNDGSSDDSADRLRRMRDPRLKLIDLPQNVGLPKALNAGLEAAQGRYVARMDADDISMPGRFAAQLYAFRNEPRLVLCGTNVRILQDGGQADERMHDCPSDPEDVRQELWFRTPMLHPTIMIDRSRIPEHAIYYLDTLRVRQDQELFLRLLEFGEARNLSETYVIYRRHEGAVTISKADLQRACRKEVIGKALTQRGIIYTRDELEAHSTLCPLLPGEVPKYDLSPDQIAAWSDRLYDHRRRLGVRDDTRWQARLDALMGRCVAGSA